MPKHVPIGFVVPPATKTQLEALAQEHDTTLSQLMRKLCRAYLRAHGRDQQAPSK